uniref:Uncharacterized protein n=1 Tax=Rhizophora mucronata TaxID=61149 RepID=A0A2P2J064_RHIMU
MAATATPSLHTEMMSPCISSYREGSTPTVVSFTTECKAASWI